MHGAATGTDPHEAAGRVIITWPAPHNGVLPVALISLRDADTGTPLLGALELHIDWNEAPLVHCDLVELCDENGQPLHGPSVTPRMTAAYLEHSRQVAHTRGQGEMTPEQLDALDDEFTGDRYCTSRRRYLVAEMRIADGEN